MSRIVFNQAPPAPTGVSELQLTYLRNELDESTIQTLLSMFQHSVPAYDIRAFGTNVGTGSEVADTEAFLTAAEEFSRNFETGQQASSAVINVPYGTYYIATQIEQIGGPGNGLLLRGDGGTARGLNQTVIKCTGDAGDTMFHWRGMNGSVVENITFNGNELAGCCFWASEYNDAINGLIGSSGLHFNNCYFSGLRPNAASVAFKVGLDDGVTASLQASEYRWYNCYFVGHGSGPGLAGIHILTPGNCKNFTCRLCVFNIFDYGFYQPDGSGITTLDECQFAQIGYNQNGWAAYMGSGNMLDIRALQMENQQTDYVAGAVFTSNGVKTKVDGGYYGGTPQTASDYAMFFGGPWVLSNFEFEKNTRVGANVCKVQTDHGGVAESNDWAHNGTALVHVPIYDGSGNHIISDDVGRYSRLNVTAKANLSGEFGLTHQTYLPFVDSRSTLALYGALFEHDVSTGVTIDHCTGKYGATIPYTAFQTAALTKTLDIGKVNPETLVKAVYAFTNTALTGTAGTLTLEVGYEDDIDGFLVSHSVAGTGVKGIADADMGVLLSKASTSSESGFLIRTINKKLQCKLTSSSGNLSGLSAGSIRIVVLYEYLGSSNGTQTF